MSRNQCRPAETSETGTDKGNPAVSNTDQQRAMEISRGQWRLGETTTKQERPMETRRNHCKAREAKRDQLRPTETNKDC